MTLPELAASMRLTQDRLKQTSNLPGSKRVSTEQRRQFIALAYAEGHPEGAIGRFMNRSTVAVLHQLRMHCLETYGNPYERSLSDMAGLLRGKTNA